MKYQIIFAGFRHGHIMDLYRKAENSPYLNIGATCEEDPETRPAIEITHRSFDEMLAVVPCDIVAIGDYYGKHGSLIIRSLKAGKHVIADKPVCTNLKELDEIEKLLNCKNLQLGCIFDLRANANVCSARDMILGGELGEIHAIHVDGQHSLMPGTRPGWYFEDGKHGGTINDIGIHAIDLIPWMTGLIPEEIIAARTWNAFAVHAPEFRDGAQIMLKLNNGCGVMGDFSYFAPEGCGSRLPYYWRFVFWGTKGVLEFNIYDPVIKLSRSGSSGITELTPPSQTGPDYLTEFLAAVEERPAELDTATVVTSSRRTLLIQQAADTGEFPCRL